MNTTVKPARSGIASENIQEVLDAENSAKAATLGGQQQYLTPVWMVEHYSKLLHNRSPKTALDPQVGSGNTILNGLTGWGTKKFGIDIDKRFETFGVQFIRGNCVDVAAIMDDVAPDIKIEVVNANPPFAKKWGGMDSTEWTWNFVTKYGCEGYFISNHKTIERLGIHKHPWVTHYAKHENVWEQCDVVVGVVVWRNPDAVPSEAYRVLEAWDLVGRAHEEEKGGIPEWNVWLEASGKLKTYLSTRIKTKKKLKRDDILNLTHISGAHPLALTTERETRKILMELVACGFYNIQPEALAAINSAIAEVSALACPVMPITDFETVAYADEEDSLLCIHSALGFTAGKRYELKTSTYTRKQTFTRDKVHFDEKTKTTFTAKHECQLTGQDRYIFMKDDAGNSHRFMDCPSAGEEAEHAESLLWEIFQKPVVKTVAEVFPKTMEFNEEMLRTCEDMVGYKYYPGQVEYLKRVGSKDCMLIGADVGTGKSLMAITLIALKSPKRALIIAPQGSMRSQAASDEDDESEAQEEAQASQWITELRNFAPYLQVFQLFSREDFERIKNANKGKLPNGVYVSYYEAMFQNGAREAVPQSWDDKRLFETYGNGTVPEQPADTMPDEKYWCRTVGKEVNGIRCICEPCMSTEIGHNFDMVLCDEAHKACNLDANITQMLIRLQPRFRYALTATPIPNIVTNLFSLMGWICVPGWYKGDVRNAAWPYARGEIGRFTDCFLSKERDFTEESFRKQANPDWSGKCEHVSPIISSPARLLKLLRPTLAYISKLQCNPNYEAPKIIDIRVPFGSDQAKLYGWFLNRGNIPCKHPLIRARKQVAYLRNICADPAGFTHGGPRVLHNYNPKTLAVMELLRDMLSRGEQCVIISARVGQTDVFAKILDETGVPFSRIDSTIPAARQSQESNRFKSGKARVMLMGIKCAMAHSFPNCPNEIVASLEYSYGSLHQAKGRVDRLNSRKGVKIYCVLNSSSIEELMFDRVATKQDSATICLHGQRVPREFKPVDMSEVLASAITGFSNTGKSEDECLLEWPKLSAAIRVAAQVAAT